MDHPKISIIIPVYNSNKTIRTTVLSAIAQTYSSTEIIIIDDGSTENCLDVLSEFTGKFQYIRQPNGGASSARNTGALAATGRYLAFLDSDDSWHPQKLELQMQIRNHDFDFDICYCGFSDAKEAHQDPLKLDVSKIKRMSTDDIYANPCFGLPNVIICKDTFNEIRGFDRNLVTAEDIDLYLRAAKAGKAIVNLGMKLMFRLQREDSLSNQVRSYTDFADVIRRNARESGASISVVNNTLLKNYKKMARFCLWSNDLRGFKYSIFGLVSLNAYAEVLRLFVKLPFTFLKRGFRLLAGAGTQA